MTEALYFGVGEDEQGFFYVVGVGDAYRPSLERFPSSTEATVALVHFLEVALQKLRTQPWLN